MIKINWNCIIIWLKINDLSVDNIDIIFDDLLNAIKLTYDYILKIFI